MALGWEWVFPYQIMGLDFECAILENFFIHLGIDCFLNLAC